MFTCDSKFEGFDPLAGNLDILESERYQQLTAWLCFNAPPLGRDALKIY
jgi:hypothetical protein